MTSPINPPSVRTRNAGEQLAYVANGVIGLRVRDIALLQGMALVSGFAGQQPQLQIEAAAPAPYPLAGDVRVNGARLAAMPEQTDALEQSYDFATGELTSRCTFHAEGCRVRIEVLTFASRTEPTLVCQEVVLEVDTGCDMVLTAALDGCNVSGSALRYARATPGRPEPVCDGVLLWGSLGALTSVGIAYSTELLGVEGDTPSERPPLDASRLTTSYAFRARPGRRYCLRQISSVVPSALHRQPDQQAVRLVAKARADGFDTIRARNRAAWDKIWKGRIHLVGAEPRWQALADAATYYLASSTHASSPASTSIFGLATWHNYHYYYGHVMWDIEAFVVPVLTLLQPRAAESLLGYRVRTLPAARDNARLRGRRGAQFAWESAPSTGDEAAPLPGTGAWYEDHVSLDVAHAFALHAKVSGDAEFLRTHAWPVLSMVSDWISSRVERTARGFEMHEVMGIAERKVPSSNSAFTNMACAVVLEEAALAAERLELQADPAWREIARGLVLPRDGDAVVSHDDFRPDEEKGATPEPLMGIWPLGYRLDPVAEQATLRRFLAQAGNYIGSPMLSALYGPWAARTGDRALALQLLEQGFARFAAPRFGQTLEYDPARFPEQPEAGPFFANIGGFLQGLLLGFPRLQPTAGPVEGWSEADIVLPEGWNAIEVEQLWIRGRPTALVAQHGRRAVLRPL